MVALGTNHCSDTSSLEIKVYNITGLEQPDLENVYIYPNPVINQFTIDLNKIVKESIEFEMLNMSGQRVHYFFIPEHQSATIIDIQHLPNGMYYIRELSGRSHLNFKIMKQ